MNPLEPIMVRHPVRSYPDRPIEADKAALGIVKYHFEAGAEHAKSRDGFLRQ